MGEEESGLEFGKMRDADNVEKIFRAVIGGGDTGGTLEHVPFFSRPFDFLYKISKTCSCICTFGHSADRPVLYML